MNLAEIVTQIKLDYPESEIEGLLQEKLRLVPRAVYEREGYTNPKDWYRDCGNGNLEDEVIWNLIEGWQKKYNQGRELPEEEGCEIHDRLIEEYAVLY